MIKKLKVWWYLRKIHEHEESRAWLDYMCVSPPGLKLERVCGYDILSVLNKEFVRMIMKEHETPKARYHRESQLYPRSMQSVEYGRTPIYILLSRSNYLEVPGHTSVRREQQIRKALYAYWRKRLLGF